MKETNATTPTYPTHTPHIQVHQQRVPCRHVINANHKPPNRVQMIEWSGLALGGYPLTHIEIRLYATDEDEVYRASVVFKS